jgi:hypothetical protein
MTRYPITTACCLAIVVLAPSSGARQQEVTPSALRVATRTLYTPITEPFAEFVTSGLREANGSSSGAPIRCRGSELRCC